MVVTRELANDYLRSVAVLGLSIFGAYMLYQYGVNQGWFSGFSFHYRSRLGLFLFLDDAIRCGDFPKFDHVHHWQIGAVFLLLGG
jgi:hypothetical protein